MNFKKVFRHKKILITIAILAGIVLAFVIINALTRSETVGPVTTTVIPYNNSSNPCYLVWVKTLKASNGFSLLKSDSYNVLSVSMYHTAFWNSYRNGWQVLVYVTGFGETRSNYGLIRANGLKTVTIGYYPTYTKDTILESSDARIFSGDYRSILPVVANISGIVPTTPFSPEVINDSAVHMIEMPISIGYPKPGVAEYYPLVKWQYFDPLSGDSDDAIFFNEVDTVVMPNKTVEVYYSSTFNWGLLDSSQNEIHLTFNLPPDPNTLTPQQLEQYNISTKKENGYTGYELDYINCTGK